MSIDTRVHQNANDDAPEGLEPNARTNTPSQVAYLNPSPDQPADDALPLDGSLTLNDTEPIDQSTLPEQEEHALIGSETDGTGHETTASAEASAAERGLSSPRSDQNIERVASDEL
jgi:hypothetical protein